MTNAFGSRTSLIGWLMLAGACALTIGACRPSTEGGRGAVEDGGRVQNSVTSELERVRGARIFFAHHSVGQNLIDGVQHFSATQPGGPLPVLTLEQGASRPGPAWLHASGGQNGQPESKVDFFQEAIEKQSSDKPKLAFMKFCYVDFTPSTDVAALFTYYERALTQLKGAHPDIVFGHVTVPLTSWPTELKWRLYRLLRRPVWEDEANLKRQAFNQRLLKTFSADPIFDLARAESTRADGSREAFEDEGSTYYALDARYTTDGGHLNELGQRELGAEMIRFVARAL